jgi:hypothetical protein
MDLLALSSRLVRRWWLILGLAGLAALGAATAGASKTDEHRTKIHFVLRPDASVTNDDLPGTLDALKSDGTLVQTVIGVLRNRTILRRGAADADVTLTPEYTVGASVQPGSTLIDSTLTGPDGSVLDRLAAGYAREASTYVSASYSAYVLEPLSTDRSVGGSGPGTGQIVVLAALLGAALGVVLVAAEMRVESHFRRVSAQRADERAGRSREAEVEEEPEPAPRRRDVPRAEPEPAREPEPEPRPEPAPAAEAEPQPEREPEPVLEPGPEPWPRSELAPEHVLQAEPQPGPEPGSEVAPEHVLEPEPEPGPEPALEAEQQPELEPRAQPERPFPAPAAPRNDDGRPKPNGQPEPSSRRPPAGPPNQGAPSQYGSYPRPATGPGPPRWRPGPASDEDED